MRRVVVTGLGMVSPLGVGIKANWEKLTASQSGINAIQSFDVSDFPCKIAGQIPLGSGNEGYYNPDEWMAPKEQRKVDRFIVYAMCATHQALEDAGWLERSDEESERTGVLIGSGIGGLEKIYESSVQFHEKGVRKVTPYFIPSILINLASGQISIKYNLKGPNHAVVTACSTGAHAIGDAAKMIRYGDADVMVAGGAEAGVTRVGVAGFCALRALSTHSNDNPTKASRPWDKDRDGFVMGDGSGVIVLEELEHAKKRGAKIYGEVVGYGMSGDAFHITAPQENGDGAYRSMSKALKSAQISSDKIDYINAHGTSTPLGDVIEYKAVKRIFEKNKTVSMSSTKSSIGHLLGAAGSVEAIYCLLSIYNNVVPPTLNLDNPDVDGGIDLVPHIAKEKKVEYALSNSFGFGGTNASLILKSYD